MDTKVINVLALFFSLLLGCDSAQTHETSFDDALLSHTQSETDDQLFYTAQIQQDLTPTVPNIYTWAPVTAISYRRYAPSEPNTNDLGSVVSTLRDSNGRYLMCGLTDTYYHAFFDPRGFRYLRVTVESEWVFGSQIVTAYGLNPYVVDTLTVRLSGSRSSNPDDFFFYYALPRGGCSAYDPPGLYPYPGEPSGCGGEIANGSTLYMRPSTYGMDVTSGWNWQLGRWNFQAPPNTCMMVRLEYYSFLHGEIVFTPTN